MTLRLDKLGVVIAAIVAYAAFLAPFATFRANRIVPGQARSILDALPLTPGIVLLAIVIVGGIIALLRTPLVLRLAASVIALATLAILIGVAGAFLTPAGNTFARVAPASGFWLLVFAFTLLLADVLTRLNLPPLARVGALAAAALAIAALLASGSWDNLSILKEYASRADSFWAEAYKHITLALGSLAAAVVVGLPLGILCHRVERLRAGVCRTVSLFAAACRGQHRGRPRRRAARRQ
jgi:osmoprotectant transport system permease protein